MTIQDNLKYARSKNNVSPLDAEILLSYVIGRSKEFLIAHPEFNLKPNQENKFKRLVAKRSKGEPVAYLTGQKEFYGINFAVNKNVLIPRPETELLVEQALKVILDQKRPRPDTIIDIGTGSGNIIISIIKNLDTAIRKKINFIAADISSSALKTAIRNSKILRVEKYIEFVRSDLLTFLMNAPKEKMEMDHLFIVANLPYLSHKLFIASTQDVRVYEPKNALLSPQFGLEHYIRLLRQIKRLERVKLAKDITVIAEISPEQHNTLKTIIKSILPSANIAFEKDLCSRWRIAIIKIE